MTQHILGTALACMLLASCTSVPPTDPAAQASASERNASDSRLNDMAAVALEHDLRELERTHAAERSGLMEKMKEMSSELADLRNRMQTNQIAQATPPAGSTPAAEAASAAGYPAVANTSNTKTNANTVRNPSRLQGEARAGKAVAAAKTAPHALPLTASSRVNRETIVIQENGMIFRVMHDFARTEFHPSQALQQQLLQAARAGRHIEIRGRTDAGAANDIDRNIAMQRALNARVFLANHGIHPRKMHIDYLAAGDHVADNRTADGRARNRRVEIETAGITPDVLEDLAAVIRQDLQ